MNRRPLSITLLGWLFIAVGSVALVYHLTEIKLDGPFDYRLAGTCLVRLLAIAGGAAILRCFNWGRWLLAVWMGFHIGISVLHSPVELGMHVLLFGVIGYFLFRPAASAYFRERRPRVPHAAPPSDNLGGR